MTVGKQLAALLKIIADEAESNENFRNRLGEVLNTPGPSTPLPAEKKRGRRAAATLDPIALARQSEDALRRELSRLDIERLKDIVAQYGMDPGKLVMKWKDTARIIDRIVELSMARSTKGDAFRADKSPAPDAMGD